MYWEFWLQIVPILVLLGLGFTVGSIVERAHFKRLDEREAILSDMYVTDLKVIPVGGSVCGDGLVTGEAVIGSDYFKTVAAKLKSLFGGELRTFQTLMVRARREALLRMMERAKAMGANGVINVRFETSNIGAMRRKKPSAMVEMYAYGTAVNVPGQRGETADRSPER